jgi:hypothetical protein
VALANKDSAAMDQLAVASVAIGIDHFFEDYAREELAALPQETRDWWLKPCNCNGALN